MPVRWRFRDYRTKEDKVPFRDWIRAQPKVMQADFITRRSHLSVIEEWTADEDGAKDLTRPEHAGLTEILLGPYPDHGIRERFRPVGVKLVETHEFVLLGGATKLGSVYTPANAFKTAKKLMRELKAELGKRDDHQF